VVAKQQENKKTGSVFGDFTLRVDSLHCELRQGCYALFSSEFWQGKLRYDTLLKIASSLKKFRGMWKLFYKLLPFRNIYLHIYFNKKRKGKKGKNAM